MIVAYLVLKRTLYDWLGWNQQLFFALNGVDSAVLDAVLGVFSVLGDYQYFPFYLLAGLGYAAWLRRRGRFAGADRMQQALWRFALGYAAAFVLVGALKVAFDFPRPAAVFGPDAIHWIGNGESRYALPSGHAAFAALIATAFWPAFSRYGRTALLLFAAAVGVSRIGLGVHFPADVVTGYFCGAAAGLLAHHTIGVWHRDRVAGIALLGAVSVWASDQWSKTAVVLNFALGDSVPLTSFFNLVYWQNTGAAFGFLSQASGWQKPLFLVIGLVASVVLYRLILSASSTRFDRFGYAFILGGAVSNVFDRIFRGAVVDWLDFHWGSWHWPAFNIADAGITLGAVTLVIAAFRRPASVAGEDRA